MIVLRAADKEVVVGGTQQSGWLPAGAGRLLPEPIRAVRMSLEIDDDAGGYLLCCSSKDASLYADTWHETLAQAKWAAQEDFGVQDHEWVPAQLAVPAGTRTTAP
jgi:hypothetical protein